MTISLFIIGAGGFGREVLSIVEAIAAAGGPQYDIVFVDDNPATADLERVASLGSRVVGTVDFLVARREPFAAVIAIGSNAAREAIAGRLVGSPVTYPTLVHPDATIGRDVDLGTGTVIAAGARLSTGIHLGRHVHVDQNATVGHDSHLGDFSRLNPQACISGAVAIGSGVLVGASAVVLPGLALAGNAIIGSGAVVTRNVAAAATVKGVPAR